MSEDGAGVARPRSRLGVTLLALSVAVIAAQLLQVRIFSFAVNHAFVYMAVSLALLGFGIAGTASALWPGVRRLAGASGVAFCLAAFGITLVAANAAFARLSDHVLPEHGLSLLSIAALPLLVFVVPFFFAGLGVILALLTPGVPVGRTYAINLAGSGIGAFVLQPLLGPLGAPALVLLGGAFCLVVAGVAARGRARVAAFVLAALVLLGLLRPHAVLPFSPDRGDQLAAVLAGVEQAGGDLDRVEELHARWDPVGKIEVHRLPGGFGRFAGEAPALFFSQDAGAGSFLLALDEHAEARRALTEGTLYGLASRLRPGGEVAVIGLGGGPDLLAALGAGAARVVGVDINAAVIDLLGRAQRDFLALPPPESGRLELVHADGRSFVRRRRGRFDVLQMTGADTYAASATGGSMLSENYLYTIEAFGDHLDALKPGGLLAVTRFGEEGTRVFTTVVEALRRRGAERPERHVMMVTQGEHAHWRLVLASADPFSTAEIARVTELCAESVAWSERATLPMFQAIGFGFDAPMHVAFHGEMGLDVGEGLARLKEGALDLSPVPDDRPYFFQFQRLGELELSDLWSREPLNRHHAGLRDYLVIVVQIALFALVVIVLPLPFLRRRSGRVWRGLPLGLYFLAIGTGYMLFEIVLMQRSALYLGHPNHAIAVVLGALLFASGVGSASSRLWGRHRWLGIGVAAAGVFVWVTAFATWSQPLFEASFTLPLALRCAIIAAWVAPLGLALGSFFPLALQEAEEGAPVLSPWLIGVNAFASVLASLGAIPLSMAAGFSRILLVAGLCYLVAVASFLLHRRLR